VKYQLVLQCRGTTMSDFDHLVQLETALEEFLGPGADVDGHDFGSGEMNLFIITDHPVETFESVLPLLEREGCLASLRAGYREIKGEKFTVLWPLGLDSFRII